MNFYIVVAFLMDGSNVSSNCIRVVIVAAFGDGYYRVAPFILDNTGGGNFTWAQLLAQPWCTGQGKYDAPYVIQKIIIDGKDIGTCLELRHSDVYFTIKNSTFSNSGAGSNYAGILSNNITNAKLTGINCSSNKGHGIFLKGSGNNTITNNNITNNSYNGIFIDPSHDNLITNNNANSNGWYGIFIEDSSNNTVINNFANDNGKYGIYLENCTENDVISNIINGNSYYGVFLNNSHVNTISHNNINNNPTGIFLNNSNFNTVLNNIITDHDEGKAIIEFNCTGNIFEIPGVISGGGGSSDAKEETTDILIFVIIIGVLGTVSMAGLFQIKRSRTKLGEREKEIESLKKQREEITEDDIAISKEKRFCIVHRGPIEGYNYICPECGTYYCIKCLDALIDIENTCWSCKKPLDPSKAIKSADGQDGIKPIIDDDSNGITEVSESRKKPKEFHRMKPK